MKLEVHDLSFAYGDHRVLEKVRFDLEAGQFTCLLGANGSGKSTLFSCLLQLHTNYDGHVLYDGRDLADMTARERAKLIAYIPQSHAPVFNYRVIEVVLMAVQGKNRMFYVPREREELIARDALERVGMAHLAERGYAKLSGGERQLVLIARALAQGSKILIMDEPTSSLDYGNQIKILSMSRELAKAGYLVFQSTHHPDQALAFADRVLLLHDGGIIASGEPRKALTSEHLSRIYGVGIDVVRVPETGLVTCVPRNVR